MAVRRVVRGSGDFGTSADQLVSQPAAAPVRLDEPEDCGGKSLDFLQLLFVGREYVAMDRYWYAFCEGMHRRSQDQSLEVGRVVGDGR